jgi:hypothetical protein
MMQQVLSGWNLSKIIRVGLGLLILISSIMEKHSFGIIAGGLYTFLSLVSDGSCCYNAPGAVQKNFKTEDIQYEEVGTKK